MAREQAPLGCCMIEQELDPKHFIGWTDEELQAVKDQNYIKICDILYEKLVMNGLQPTEMYCNIHNLDSQQVWDLFLNDYVTEQKLIHFHCVVKFLKGCNSTLNAIALAVGLETQFIEKPKTSKYSYDNMLAYLIHAKDADKYQYDPETVYSKEIFIGSKQINRDYMDVYCTNKLSWQKGRAKKKKDLSKANIDYLEDMILNGKITKSQILLTDEYYSTYTHYKSRCDEAFDSYAQRKIEMAIQAMKNGDFLKTVYFITGKSHMGKSTFTDNLVRKLVEKAKEIDNETWSVCSVAANNPFDEYMGEEILVMDDLRGISLVASDWLKLLDSDRINIGSARYRNKKMACKVIIINSEKDVLEFFYFLKNSGGGDRSEAMDQFFRRILAKVIVYKPDIDSEVRRVQIGCTQETSKYQLQVKGLEPSIYYPHETLVTLHHDFKKNVSDMEYDEALEYLSTLALDRNNINKKEVIVSDG